MLSIDPGSLDHGHRRKRGSCAHRASEAESLRKPDRMVSAYRRPVRPHSLARLPVTHAKFSDCWGMQQAGTTALCHFDAQLQQAGSRWPSLELICDEGREIHVRRSWRSAMSSKTRQRTMLASPDVPLTPVPLKAARCDGLRGIHDCPRRGPRLANVAQVVLLGRTPPCK
jgi:hypothetical protein